MDPDKDILVYDIAISKDNGKTWIPIKKRWRPANQTTPAPASQSKPAQEDQVKPKPVSPPDPSKQLAEMKTNLNGGNPLPAAVRAQILAQAPDVIKKTNAMTAAAAKADDAGATNLKETSFMWDSSEMPDGTYILKVTVSDKASEPDNPLTASAKTGPFLVVNTPPDLTAGEPMTQSDKSVIVKGTARSKMALIKAVQYKLDDADPYSASADDGIFDTLDAAFTLHTQTLSKGNHTLEITAFDWAGNTVSKSVKVTIP
jgi:hypothetical protein